MVLISEMQNGFFLLSPAAAAFFSSMLFLGDMDSAAAVFLAAAVHEMSHLLMLVVYDYRITSIEMNMNGLCIRYAGKEDMTSKFLSNISGPLGGVIFYMLEKLPAAQREAVILHYFYQFTAKEIAQMTNTPLPTIKSRLRAARNTLSDALREDFT